MKKTLLLAGAAVCLFAVNAHAFDVNPYVSAKLRYSIMDNELKASDYEDTLKLSGDDNVFGGSLAVGAASSVYGGAVRAELEYNRNAEAKDTTYNVIGTEVEVQSTMLNAYYDIDTGTKFTPYVGAGLGFAKVKGTLKFFGENWGSESQYNFAWQIGAGVGYALNNNVTLDAGYRYVDYGHWTVESIDETDRLESKAHELYIGARYNF